MLDNAHFKETVIVKKKKDKLEPRNIRQLSRKNFPLPDSKVYLSKVNFFPTI